LERKEIGYIKIEARSTAEISSVGNIKNEKRLCPSKNIII